MRLIFPCQQFVLGGIEPHRVTPGLQDEHANYCIALAPPIHTVQRYIFYRHRDVYGISADDMTMAILPIISRVHEGPNCPVRSLLCQTATVLSSDLANIPLSNFQ